MHKLVKSHLTFAEGAYLHHFSLSAFLFTKYSISKRTTFKISTSFLEGAFHLTQGKKLFNFNKNRHVVSNTKHSKGGCVTL